MLWLLSAAVLVAQAGERLVFEAEDVSEPAEAWLADQFTEDHWNLWSTDSDAELKWSGGVTLQSPRVMEDRATPEEGAPVLHTRIEGIPAGTYGVEVKLGRALAVSLDGETWTDLSKTRGFVGKFEITDGTFDLWVDDRFAAEENPGSSYYDCLVFRRNADPKPKVTGWAKERVTEPMGRALIARPLENGGVYVGWRLLADDPADSAFHVYRSVGRGRPIRLTDEPVAATTDFVDRDPAAGPDLSYFVRPVLGGAEGEPSNVALVRPDAKTKPYISLKLDGEHEFQKAAIADLDGDGAYDFVLKQPNENIDPYEHYWTPSPDTYKLEAYLGDGALLWRKDLGWSIERGIWYSPYLAYDLDGDGRAEVAVKTGEGDPRDADGRVQEGPEWLSIWDGMTGEEVSRAPWPSRDDLGGYNYASRNQLGIAYLDGKTPCLLVERGTYRTIKLTAYQFRDRRLEELWTWTSEEEAVAYGGQGAHFMHAADVDADGRDEVILGSCVIDDNGNGLWSTVLGHPDHCYVGDIDPSHAGLEIYYGIEPGGDRNKVCLVDAATGEVLWGVQERTWHVHNSGLCSDFMAEHPGMECYSGEKEMPEGAPHRWLHTAAGELLAREDTWDVGLSPRAAYWDADPHRELLLGKRVVRYPNETIFEGIEGDQIAWADILGDWREEIVTTVAGELRVYTTTIPATDRHPCLMRDPIYRLDVVHLAMGYAQPPMVTRCIPPG